LWPVSEIEISVGVGLCEADRGGHPPDCDRFGLVEGNGLGRPPPDEADKIWVAVGLLASLIGTEVMIGVGDLLAGLDGGTASRMTGDGEVPDPLYWGQGSDDEGEDKRIEVQTDEACEFGCQRKVVMESDESETLPHPV
jgi:hypothetical protein